MIAVLDPEEMLEPGPDGYHCASCNRALSTDDGILAIVAPATSWASDYWRLEHFGYVIPDNRIVFLGVLHEDCQREWYFTVDQNGDVWHGGECATDDPIVRRRLDALMDGYFGGPS